MKNNKVRALTAGLLAAAVIAPTQNAMAASGQTNVSIDFPNIVILHYVSDLSLTFTGAIDTATDEGAASGSAALAATASFDAAISPDLTTPTVPGSVAVTVQNAWAVRGITASGQIRVSGAIDTANATTAGGSTASMSNLAVASGASSGALIDIDAPGMGTTTAGDVTFDLDISGVTESGTHSGAQYTITAIATP